MRLDPRDAVRFSALSSPDEILAGAANPYHAARPRRVSAAGLRPLQAKLSRNSNQIARGRIRQFESYMPSHAVSSLRSREEPRNGQSAGKRLVTNIAVIGLSLEASDVFLLSIRVGAHHMPLRPKLDGLGSERDPWVWPFSQYAPDSRSLPTTVTALVVGFEFRSGRI
jgi:hypothetical protein